MTTMRHELDTQAGRAIDRAHPWARPDHSTTSRLLLDLQRSAGNAAVSRALDTVVLQRTIGDSHDLASPRFAGDPQLEACFDDEARLTVGARGDSVAAIQQALTDLGEVLPSGVDGIYGQETWDAVKRFKADQRLTPSTYGDVGPKTMARLDELLPDDGGDGVLPPCPSGLDDIVTADAAVPQDSKAKSLVRLPERSGALVNAALIPGVTCQAVRPTLHPFPPTRLGDLSVAERQSLVVDTGATKQGEIDGAYIPFQPRSSTRNVATTSVPLTFAESVPANPEVRNALVRVAQTLRASTPPSLVPGRIRTVVANDQPIQPNPQQPPTGTIPGGLFRFTNYLHGRTEVILVERIGPVPAPIAALGFPSKFFTVDDLARAQFAGRHPGMTAATTWVNPQEIGVLDEAITHMGAAAARAGTLVFERSGRTVGPLNESGHFDPNTRHIEIFQSAFTGAATRVGGSELSTFTICHEVGHAISDRDPTLRPAFATAASRDGTATVRGGTRLTGAVTEYGNTSMEEYLAEAIALRALSPDVLAELRPAAATFLDQRLP